MSRARTIADFGDGIATADIDDGAVTEAKINSAVALGITQADIWRLNAGKNLAQTTEEVISSNLERADDATSGLIGSGVSESSGIFTFPETGIYLVRFIAVFGRSANGVNEFRNRIGVSSDSGSSFDIVAQSLTGATTHTVSITNYGQGIAEALIDVTNASTFQVRFTTSTVNANVVLIGGTSASSTCFTFIRLGDT